MVPGQQALPEIVRDGPFLQDEIQHVAAELFRQQCGRRGRHDPEHAIFFKHAVRAKYMGR
jgi:hypothetical protein